MTDQTPRPVVLVDLGNILYPFYMTGMGNPDPEFAAHATIARVHDLARGDNDPRTAICCDGGKTFRHDLDPTYKGNRKDKDEALIHQLRLAQDTLRGDGFAVWQAPGFEADDLIASAVAQLEEGTPIIIVTGDKDLLQLVGGPVVAKSTRDGSIVDAEGVFAKFAVVPAQMVDYLCLVGDAADNVMGAKGIGPKKASDLLARFGSLNAYYAAADGQEAVAGVPPSVVASLAEFKSRLTLTRRLITLRTDAPVPIEELDAPRTSPPMEAPGTMTDYTPSMIDLVAEPAPAPETPAPEPATHESTPTPQAVTVVHAAPAEWERQLEPRSMSEVITLAKYVHDSRQFLAAYGTPQAVLCTLLAGRELGIQAMASLRAFHVVEGKPTLAADFIRSLVVKSGEALYFRCTERTADRATFTTRRKDDPDHEISLTYTVEDAQTAQLGGWDGQKFKVGSGWFKSPADQCVARASAKLARLVYPEIVFGLYAPEEIEAA